eukprot:m.186623 g.186623  ORF g.186623 m.186623 type:complete len:207 (+) comp53567_c0_seq3:250-870(+)
MSVCMGFGDRRAHFCLCSLSPCSAAPPMPKVSLLEDQIRELQVQLTAERAKNEQLCMQLATHTPSQAAPDAHQHHHQQLASSRVEQEIHQLQRVNHEQAAELMRLRQLLSHAQYVQDMTRMLLPLGLPLGALNFQFRTGCFSWIHILLLSGLGRRLVGREIIQPRAFISLPWSTTTSTPVLGLLSCSSFAFLALPCPVRDHAPPGL